MLDVVDSGSDNQQYNQSRPLSQISTTVFTGFLGSGKTTIINHLVEHLTARGEKIAYVKNEIGEEDLDTKLVQGNNIATRELLNGCICCTLVGPFMAAIDELADKYHLDRIIIETAGTADPASMALSVSNHPRLLRDGVITIIDVVNFDGYEDITQVARRQAEMTDVIVFNKVELVDDERKQQVVGYVRELNELAPIIEAPQGRLNPELAFGIGASNTELNAFIQNHFEEDTKSNQDHASHDQSHFHQNEDGIDAFTFVSDQVFSKQNFELTLRNLPKNVFRIKGITHFDDGWQVVNNIFKRTTYSIPPTNLSPTQTRLIVIGYGVASAKESISILLQKSVQVT